MLSNLPFQNCHLTPPLASGHAVGSTSSSFIAFNSNRLQRSPVARLAPFSRLYSLFLTSSSSILTDSGHKVCLNKNVLSVPKSNSRLTFCSALASQEQESESVVKQRSVSVVLLAGGKGKRMGANMPKQYFPLLGQPIALYRSYGLLNGAAVLGVPFNDYNQRGKH
uniref:Uncharacterized protein LOC101512669 n=1 Tax=Cicer arietinum TaxID=3827 RepID=A0A3Q7Y326_CICAR|nr:uncharacterized protein LOC101512669 [Cicer arietinum]